MSLWAAVGMAKDRQAKQLLSQDGVFVHVLIFFLQAQSPSLPTKQSPSQFHVTCNAELVSPLQSQRYFFKRTPLDLLSHLCYLHASY